jgi:cytochrome b involved in lipid metabolism
VLLPAPGGFDIILSNTGKDATEDFEEIGHSNAAKEMLTKYHIGSYEVRCMLLPPPCMQA